MVPRKHIALRYMVGFRCLGAECEDDCCHGWTVTVDQPHYAKIKKAMARDPVERERFAASVALSPAAQRTRARFAVLMIDEQGRCPMLDERRLCSLQARHGEPLLPDVCATYPRVISEAGERVELAGDLSCPEVARRCLLAEDGTDLVEVPPEALGRGLVRQRAGAREPYAALLDAIRGTLYRLVSRTEYPVAARLFFATCFAQKTAPFFHRGASPGSEAQLRFELDCIERRDILDELHVLFTAQAPERALTFGVLVSFLADWVRRGAAASLQEVVRRVLESLAPGDGERLTVEPETLRAAYQARCAEREGRHQARIERYLHNYARHYFVRDWYTAAPNLLVHVQRLLVRVAVLRFLLLAHPALEDPAQVDAAAVAICYALARALDHNDEMLRSVSTALEEQLPTLAHAVSLLKL